MPQPGPMQGAKRTLPERRGAVPRELAAVTDAADADLAAAASELEAAAAALGAASTLDPGAADFVPAAPTAGGTGGGQSEMRAALERVEAREGDGAAATRLPYARMQTWAPRRRGGTMMLVLALFGCFCVQEGSSMPLTALQASIPYTRTSIFTGMPDDLRTHVVDIMDARLSESTWRTVRAGVKRWWVTCANRRFARVISTDDPERGAKFGGQLLARVSRAVPDAASMRTHSPRTCLAIVGRVGLRSLSDCRATGGPGQPHDPQHRLDAGAAEGQEGGQGAAAP